jgi:flagellar biosynthesis/type III secretory pathway M-ring protein FliF/YscJ
MKIIILALLLISFVVACPFKNLQKKDPSIVGEPHKPFNELNEQEQNELKQEMMKKVFDGNAIKDQRKDMKKTSERLKEFVKESKDPKVQEFLNKMGLKK